MGAVVTTLMFSTPVNAKITMQFCHVFANGCIGTHSNHSAFFGIFTWETYEVIAC